MIKMIDVGVKVTDLDIKRIEKKLKIILPESYKNFLKESNGGRCDPDFFPIQGLQNNPFGHIQNFLSIDDSIESCRPDWAYETYFGRMPKGFFPIAYEDCGNVICLSLSGNTEGKVYYWDHDNESIPPTFDNVYKIADSFNEFLESIYFVDISTL